eukprot:3782759-Pyramimonas_sp.AAC.2
MFIIPIISGVARGGHPGQVRGARAQVGVQAAGRARGRGGDGHGYAPAGLAPRVRPLPLVPALAASAARRRAPLVRRDA